MQTHTEMMQRGVAEGWWEDYDEHGPIRVWRVKLFDEVARVTVKRSHNVHRYTEIPRPRYLSQLLTALGFYDSVSSARRAGHTGEVEEGDLKIRLPLPSGGRGTELFRISKGQ